MARISIRKDAVSGKLNIQRGAVDPFFNNVSLLLPMNASFADFSSNNFTVTANGNVQISSAQSKFGGSSALFDGSDYLVIDENSQFNLGDGSNYTVEMWVNMNSFQGQADAPRVISFQNSSSSWGLLVDPNNANGNLVWNNYGTSSGDIIANNAITLNTWSHIALVKNGLRVSLYVDGTERGFRTDTNAMPNGNTRITIAGSTVQFAYQVFYGYIDDLRITKGVARYTSNFTPPGPLFNIGKINISKPIFPMANLLAFWRLEGLTDSSGNGNSLTNNNSVQFVAGKIGNCAEFNGSDNYLSLGSFSSSFYSDSPYTFSLWYNITTLKNYFTLIGCYNTGTFNIHGFVNGDLAVNNSAAADASIAGFFTTNSWNHMVVSRDISGNIKIYKNAVQLYNAPAQVTYGLVPFIEIGALSTYGSVFATNGKIDAVGIWSRALTEEEIQALYNDGNGAES
jgi:hypothetical protein